MSRRIKSGILNLMLLAWLAGCDSGGSKTDTDRGNKAKEKNIAPVKPVPGKLKKGLPQEPVTRLLTVADPTPPEEWLASLYRFNNGTPNEAGIDYYRKLLERIQPHVHEDRRMIANRTVQISRSLQEQHMLATPEQILEGFANQLDSIDGHYVYGELCAHYANLRSRGLPHQQALDLLFTSLNN